MKWSVVFLLIAVGAALLGFGELHDGSATVAKAVSFISMFLFVIALFKESPSKRAIRTNMKEKY